MDTTDSDWGRVDEENWVADDNFWGEDEWQDEDYSGYDEDEWQDEGIDLYKELINFVPDILLPFSPTIDLYNMPF